MGDSAPLGSFPESQLPLYQQAGTPALQLKAAPITVIAEERPPTGQLRRHLDRPSANGQIAANKGRPVSDPIARIGLITPISGGAGLNDPHRNTRPQQHPARGVALSGSNDWRRIQQRHRD